MTVLTTRAVAATITALRTQVRDATSDPGATTANQRWSNTQIDKAIDFQLAQMYNKLSGDDASFFKLSTDIAYAANAQSAAIPIDIAPNSLYQVQDVTDPNNPLNLDWLDTFDADRFQNMRGWTLIGPNIAIRPLPSAAVNARLWYIPPYVPISGASTPTTDQHNMLVNQEELIVLGAAIRLQENDAELPAGRVARYQMLWEDFKISAGKYRGPVYVNGVRSFR